MGGGQARRFVVQLHRARRLHYDLRFEIDGVLASWAVPRGPTLDPTARRRRVHVEDHPIEYVDFEGVIPAGEYGGGDVIVWDAGTWEPHGTDDPAAAVAAGELHAEVYGQKLRGRLVLVRRGRGRLRQGRVAAAAQAGRARRRRLGPGGPSALGAQRAHQRRGEGRPRAPLALGPARRRGRRSGCARRSRRGPDDDELAALDALGANGHLGGVRPRAAADQPGQGACSRPRAGEPPVTKRELVRYAAQIAPVVLPYLRGPPAEPAPLPERRGRQGLLAQAAAAARAGLAPAVGQPGGRTRARPRPTSWSTSRRRWCGRPTSARWSGTPGRPRPTSRTGPTYALVDLDPGAATSWDDLLVLARLHRTAFEHLGVRAQPKVTGRRGIQIWVPIARGPGFDETRAWVEQVSRTVGAVVPELVSWKWEVQRARRPGPAGLHAERDQQDARRAVQPAGRRRRAGVRADRVGRARRPGAATGRLHDPRRCSTASPSAATRSGPCSPPTSACPRSPDAAPEKPGERYSRGT